ncbi:MAG: cold shock domain-containing protein [Deltaproteobacteria bacterium]|nr:cold shock domain-containing protein [Deltaproteobacteria bacterium]
MAETLRGVVKWFNDAKGFGFIEHETGRDVFVHYSVIAQEGFKTLKDGEEVAYELQEGDKGLHAARVDRIHLATQKAEGEGARLVPEAKDLNMTAPNLESGSLKSVNKPISESIEVEHTGDTSKQFETLFESESELSGAEKH